MRSRFVRHGCALDWRTAMLRLSVGVREVCCIDSHLNCLLISRLLLEMLKLTSIQLGAIKKLCTRSTRLFSYTCVFQPVIPTSTLLYHVMAVGVLKRRVNALQARPFWVSACFAASLRHMHIPVRHVQRQYLPWEYFLCTFLLSNNERHSC